MELQEHSNYIIERIERIRKEKNLSRYRLSQRSEISQSTITNLLNRNNIPSIQTLEKICYGLDMTLAQFFSIDGERPNLTKEQKRILDMWDQLNDIQKVKVEAYMQGMLDKD